MIDYHKSLLNINKQDPEKLGVDYFSKSKLDTFNDFELQKSQ